MGTFTQQVLSFITQPAGNYFYHLWLVFLLTISLFVSGSLLNKGQSSTKTHTTIVFSVLLAFEVLYIILEGLSGLSNFELNRYIPLLDRVFSAMSLVVIAWLWAYPVFNRQSLRWVIALETISIILLLISVPLWQPANLSQLLTFSPVEWIWQIFSLLIILSGFTLLVTQRPPNVNFGFVFLGLALLGHLAQLIFSSTEVGIAGLVHISYLFASPLLLIVASRDVPVPTTIKRPNSSTRSPLHERRRYSADPKTIHALLNLALERDPENVSVAIARAVSQALLADISILISINEDAQMNMEGGYDLIREEDLSGRPIEKDGLPLVSNSIIQRRSLRLPSGIANATDIKTLGQLLKLNNAGNLLVVPMLDPEQVVLGGIILLSPYSNRLWSGDDQVYLEKITGDITPLYLHFRNLNQTGLSADELHSKLEKATREIEDLNQTIANLKVEIQALTDAQERQMNASNSNQLENELRLALTEIARLQNTLAKANMRILQLEKNPPHETESLSIDNQ